MSENEDKVGFISKIGILFLCMILIVTVSTILITYCMIFYQNLTYNINENALAIIVIGFNLTLFQFLWFTLRLFEARHNPNEETEILNKQGQHKNLDVDSIVKTEVHIAVNQSKGDA